MIVAEGETAGDVFGEAAKALAHALTDRTTICHNKKHPQIGSSSPLG
jgi:hypothetical protein